jgi:hypothetical protein
MKDSVRIRDPLLPIDFIVTGLLGLVVVMVLFFTGLTIFGRGSTFGVGEPDLCLDTRLGMSFYGPEQYKAYPLIAGLATGATAVPNSASICADATTRIHIYYAATGLPSTAFFVGALVVVFALIKVARRLGVFAMPVVRMARVLGWYLIVGTLAATVVEATAKAGLFHQLVPGQDEMSAIEFVHLDIPVLIIGFGIITVARVLRIASGMQREIDATV